MSADEREDEDELVLDRATEVIQINEAGAAPAPRPAAAPAVEPEGPVDFPEPLPPPAPGPVEHAQRWLRLAAPLIALVAVGLLFGNVWRPAYRALTSPSGGDLFQRLVPGGGHDAGGSGPLARPAAGGRLPVLYVNSLPPGARVSVDGIDQGPTPVATTVECAPGREDMLVILRLDGFRSWTRNVSCLAKHDLVLEATLEAKSARAP